MPKIICDTALFHLPKETRPIKELAEIFRQREGKDLTTWQKAVNEAAVTLVEDDLSLSTDRRRLFEMSREEVSKSYEFKKGKSRSNSIPNEPKPNQRCPNTDTKLRNLRSSQLKDEVEFNIHETVKLKKKNSHGVKK